MRAEHPMARHTAYAYVLRKGHRVRYSDDGEPQRTAGMPILDVLQHARLADVTCTVTRYFGGTLLGTGGLVRAYTAAAQVALGKAQLVRFASCCDIRIVVAYSDYNPLSHWLDAQGYPVIATDYGADVTVTVRVLSPKTGNVCSAIDDFCQGRAVVEPGSAHIAPIPAR